MEELDIVVIGAGMAGLMAASLLQEHGREVVVLDKARGPGGRMSTRRFGEYRLDHGAQFFTVRNPEFAEYVQRWESAGVAQVWSHGFREEEDGHPRYRGSEGMNSIPKWIARNLNVRTTQRVQAIRYHEQGWRLDIENHPSLLARKLLVTSPVVQTLEMLQQGEVSLDTIAQRALERIAYDRCLALMVLPKVPLPLPAHGGWQLQEEPLQFVADNASKGLPNPGPALTIHLGPQTSREHWDAPIEVLVELVQNHLQQRGFKLTVQEQQLHRWRYSQPNTLHDHPCLVAETEAPLVFAGDAFAGPKVEGAALSGLAAARVLLGN